MKLQPYFQRLCESKEYKDFAKKNSDAYLMAGFFIVDLEAGKHMHQIDFYVPKTKKVAAFTLDHKVTLQLLDSMGKKKAPEKLEHESVIDLDTLHGILEDEMKNRGMTEEIRKIIAVLQTIDGKRVWNINCILTGMGILKAHVEDESKSVLKMEKSSIMDYVKHIPAAAMQKLGQQQGVQPSSQLSQGQVAVNGEAEADEEGGGAEAQKVMQNKLEQIKKLQEILQREKEKFESNQKADAKQEKVDIKESKTKKAKKK